MPPKVNMTTELENIHQLILQIKSDLEGKATADAVNTLVQEIRLKDKKIEVLESQVAILQNTVNLLSAKCDNNEQYSRRLSLRINNVPLPSDGESADDVVTKVQGLITESGVELPADCLDRAHRVGKPVDAEDGTKKQQIIVKFTSWRHRTQFYRSRKSLTSAKVYIDLTQTKFRLLKSAQAKVRNSNAVEFVFADVNCSLCAKMANGNYRYFNTEDQLNNILGN